MRPTLCPRCARTPDTWTIDRAQGVAGCPCGEVIPYNVEEVPTDPLSTTPRRPRGWTEDARPDGFRAVAKPDLRHLWVAIPFALVFGGMYGGLYGAAAGGIAGIMVALATVAALVAFLTYRVSRASTFTMEGGRFRAETKSRNKGVDLPLDAIQRFAVGQRNKDGFDLLVVENDGAVTHLPLAFVTLHEAQFIADRANELLATDGRTIPADYRGAQMRIAEESPVRVAVEDELPAEEPADDDRHLSQRRVL